LSVLAYSFVTYVIYSAVTALVLSMRGVGSIASMQDLRAPVGLDFLVPHASLFLGAILNGINPFSIWGVWLCGTGISVTHGTSRSAGIWVATVAFLVGLLVAALPTLLLSMATKQ
jgi:hypothetical protein